MTCKKCKQSIPPESIYCMHCGAAQIRDKKKPMYQRPDGLFEKIIMVDGKRTVFRGKSENEVYRKMAEYKGAQEQGPLFKEVADNWREKSEKLLEYQTYLSYEAPYNFSLNQFGQKRIKDIVRSDVSTALNTLSQKGYTTKTIKKYWSVMHIIFAEALTDGIISINPASSLKIPKGKKSEKRRAPTPEEIEIIKQSADLPYGFLYLLCLFTGLRRGEALALQYKDFNVENKMLSVTKSVFYKSNTPYLKAYPKTEKSIRVVALPGIVINHLKMGNPDEFIFADSDKELPKYHAVRMGLINYQKETGLELTPHSLRHGYASILHSIGVSPKEAQEMLGHANIAVTMDIYTHLSNTTAKKVAEMLDRIR